MEKVRKQHYVWRYYLSAWAADDQISCLMGNRSFRSNLTGVAKRRDFYYFHDLTADEKDHLFALGSRDVHPACKALHRELVEVMTALYRMKRVDGEPVDSLARKECDVLIHNMGEIYQGMIEADAIGYLDALRHGDGQFYLSDDTAEDFLHFLCVQYMRTNKVKSDVLETVRGKSSVDVTKIWDYLSHFFAITMAFNIRSARMPAFGLQILVNRANESFLTCDQPVINTVATLFKSNEQVPNLAFYYPVSPRIAVLASKGVAEGLSKRDLGDDEVRGYNEMMFKAHHQQVFADTTVTLEQFVV